MSERPNDVGHGASSRPSIGFPIGTAFLLIVIFSLSAIISFCYHRGKTRGAFSDGSRHGPAKPKSTDTNLENSLSLPVIMPGDDVPKFIALPCPCEPSRHGKIIVEVQNLPQLPQKDDGYVV